MSEIHNEIQVLHKAFGDRANLIIFDVGACNFHDSLHLKQYLPYSTVYSFEPSDFNLKEYGQTAEARGILVAPVAVSDRDDVTTFYNSTTHNGSGSTLKPKVKEGTHEGINHDGLLYNMEGYPVQVVRLDTFCDLNNIDRIDYLHMDVQGGEFNVIKGLGKYRPYFIFAETCEFETYESGTTTEEFNEYMSALGYSAIKQFRDDTLYKLDSMEFDTTAINWLPKL